MAELKSLPTREELESAGYGGWAEWHMSVASSISGEADQRGAIPRRASCGWTATKTRNLAEKARARSVGCSLSHRRRVCGPANVGRWTTALPGELSREGLGFSCRTPYVLEANAFGWIRGAPWVFWARPP